MKILNVSAIAYAAVDGYVGEDKMEKYRAAAVEARKDLNTPIELGSLTKINYDHKSDRYAVTFVSTPKTVTLKVTNQVAEFCTANINKHGSWEGRMEEGVLVDVNLITI